MRQLAAICVGICLTLSVAMAEPSAEISFSVSDTIWFELNDYDVVELKDCHLVNGTPGTPNLPHCNLRILIPQDAKVDGISILTSSSMMLGMSLF